MCVQRCVLLLLISRVKARQVALGSNSVVAIASVPPYACLATRGCVLVRAGACPYQCCLSQCSGGVVSQQPWLVVQGHSTYLRDVRCDTEDCTYWLPLEANCMRAG